MNNATEAEQSRVLVVDDLEINLKLISEILSKNNIAVTTTNSGQEALNIVQEVNPDLILLDIAMPETDGFDVCTALKKTESTKNIPIIFLTARNQTEDVVKGLKLGAVDYLTKPYKAQELISRINIHIDLKKAKDTIRKQNEELKQNNLQLTKSLHYAKHIQDKLLPEKDLMHDFFEDYFILYMPKYIVSGDIYWFTRMNDLLFLAVLDYTGHGMPGALLSMIGNTLLNEIIIKNKLQDPGEILHQLNTEVIKTMNKGNDIEDVDNEGMDISLCVIDKNKKKIKLACANQDVYYFQQNKLHKIEGQIISIGRKVPEKYKMDFITHTIDIREPAYFYLFTDGYQDQFGGPANKKYQVINIEKIINENHHLPSNQQKDIFTDLILQWKEKTEQTDDILVIGFNTAF